jgi:transcriptional regulator with XRE-family HTH domain
MAAAFAPSQNRVYTGLSVARERPTHLDDPGENPTVPGEIRKALGSRIRMARKTRLNNLPLEGFGRQVAELMGRGRAFSNVTVSNWETGRQEPSWEALVSIARLTRLPLRYFAGAGALEDYPLSAWDGCAQAGLDPELKTLLASVQRLSPMRRRLIVHQMESLLDALGNEDARELVASRAQTG